MKIVVPHFGEVRRVWPLLERWAACYVASGARLPVHLLTDGAGLHGTAEAVMGLRLKHGIADAHIAAPDLAPFAGVVRPRQPFDVKGVLVCAQLLADPSPLLVLDADAFLARDPIEALAPFAGATVAMAVDGGAVTHDRRATLDAPFDGVRKLCAGVQFFGAVSGRSALVDGYVAAWSELAALPRPPWSPPFEHLREQHAWSIASARAGGRVLPHALNWAPHFYGRSDLAVVNHWFGLGKWGGLELPG